MSELKEKLKAQIIAQLNLEDLSPSDIENDTPFFGEEGLGLDSIDALEFIVLLDGTYGIKIGSPEEAKGIFENINTMAEFIENSKK